MNEQVKIKAIETEYRGYRFRSRTEARWAIFFDELGFKWDYELEGFKLPSGIQYLPDFYLHDFDVWFEVKGSLETTSEIDRDKINEFALHKNIIVAFGNPDKNHMFFLREGISYDVVFSPNPFSDGFQISVIVMDDRVYPKLTNAYQKACSARFEFGEQK